MEDLRKEDKELLKSIEDAGVFRMIKKRLAGVKAPANPFEGMKIKEGREDIFNRFLETYQGIEKQIWDLIKSIPDFPETISFRFNLIEDLTRLSMNCIKEMALLVE